MADEVRVPIMSDLDVVAARQQGRVLAMKIGFGSTDLTLIATAISELARNIVKYAKQGEIILNVEQEGGRTCIVVVARDHGPGISDIGRALRDGYSSEGSLGLGLPGTRRLMDEFAIESEASRGTTVTVKKWKG